MRFYLARYIGAGTDDNPFRPSGADDLPGWSAIDLRPDATKVDGFALLATPLPLLPSSSRVVLTDDPDERSATLRDRIGSRLGITLDDLPFRQLVLHLLSDHGDDANPGRWNRLRPMRDAWRVYLGGLLIERPVIAGGATITESFNKADADTLGPDLTWAEVVGDLDIVSNAAKQPTSQQSFARAESDLASSDHYSQIVVTAYGSNSASNHEVHARWSSIATTFYRGLSQNNATLTHRLGHVVAGVFTQIGTTTAETAPTVPVTIRTECSGSSISYLVNGVTKVGPVTDVTIAANTRCGFGASGAGTGQTFDSFEAGDLSNGGQPAMRRFAHVPHARVTHRRIGV